MIRQIEIFTGVVTTLAGSVGNADSKDGTGLSASFHYPRGITTDGTRLFVADGNASIRKVIIATGQVTTILDGLAVTSNDLFSIDAGITSDGVNLYVAGGSTIRKFVIATGVVTTVAGNNNWGSADGTGEAASFGYAYDITTDGHNLFVTDYYNNTIRKIN